MKNLVLLTSFLLTLAIQSRGQECINHQVNPDLLKIADLVLENGYVYFKQNIGLDPNSLFTKHKSAFNLCETCEMVLVERKKQFKRNSYHYNYQLHINNVPVKNGFFTLHEYNDILVNGNGKIPEYVEGNSVPAISNIVALNNAKAEIGASLFSWESAGHENYIKRISGDPSASSLPIGELIFIEDGGDFNLAWRFFITTLNPNNSYLVEIDALDGSLIELRSLTANATGTAETVYYGTRQITTLLDGSDNLLVAELDFVDEFGTTLNTVEISTIFDRLDYGSAPSFPGNSIPSNGDKVHFFNSDVGNNWDATWQSSYQNFAGFGAIAPTPDNTHALDIHWGMEQTFNYFMTELGRNSYNDNGGALSSLIHFPIFGGGGGGPTWQSSPFPATPGYGTVFFPKQPTGWNIWGSLDVCAHEFSHGITEGIDGEETRAVAEGLADIFGCVVEQFVLGASGNWKIAELNTPAGIFNSAGEEVDGLRDLSNPGRLNQPTTLRYNSTGELEIADGTLVDIYTGSNDYNHLFGAPLGHWFYLLSEGGVGVNANGQSYDIQGIGINEAALLVHDALRLSTTDLNSDGDFTYEEIMTGTLELAKQNWGVCSDNLSEVIEAWYAIGVIVNLPDQENLAMNNNLGFPHIEKGICANLFIDNAISGQSYFIEGFNTLIAPGNGTTAGNGLDINGEIIVPVNVADPPIACANTETICESGSFTLFESGEKILLKPGFHAQTGSQFLAKIKHCVPTDYEGKSNLLNESDDKIETVVDKWRIIAFPNPAKNELKLRSTKPLNGYYELYNLQGQKISSNKMIGIQTIINVSNLSSGMYLVRINSGNQETMIKWQKQ